MTPIRKAAIEAVDLTRPIIGIENRTAQEVFDIMCDRIRLAPPAPAVKVKPLEWDNGYAFSSVTGGFYRIHENRIGWFIAAYCMPDAMAMTRVNNEDEARSVAQADHDARIRSALTDGSSDLIDKMAEALRAIVAIWRGDGDSDNLGYLMYERAVSALAAADRLNDG